MRRSHPIPIVTRASSSAPTEAAAETSTEEITTDERTSEATDSAACWIASSLPVEVQLLIVRKCSVATRSELGATGKYFDALVVTPSIWRHVLFVQSTGLKMSDQNLERLLTKVDAKNTTVRLVLRNCPFISGRGLAPLRGSKVLRSLDLRCSDLVVPILRSSHASNDAEMIVRSLRQRTDGPPLELTIFNTLLENNLRDLREEWLLCRLQKEAARTQGPAFGGGPTSSSSSTQQSLMHPLNSRSRLCQAPCAACERAFPSAAPSLAAIADACLFCEKVCCPGVCPTDWREMPKADVNALGDTARRAALGKHAHTCTNPALRCITCTQVACRDCEVKSGFTFEACHVCGGRCCNICRKASSSCRNVAMFMRCKSCGLHTCRPCSVSVYAIGLEVHRAVGLLQKGIRRVCRTCEAQLVAEADNWVVHDGPPLPGEQWPPLEEVMAQGLVPEFYDHA